MEMIWLLIALTLFPDKTIPQDLAGEITVTHYHEPKECRNEAIKSDQRFDKYLKERGMKEKYDETVRNAGIINMAICWSNKDAQLVYPKTIDSPWLGVVVRFTLVSREPQKVGTGIGRVRRFKSLAECRKGLDNVSTELGRELKPQEEKAIFCVSTAQG